MALIIAAAVHDMGHPGLSNQYIASLNNSKKTYHGTLETFHIVAFRRLIKDPSCNFFRNYAVQNPSNAANTTRILNTIQDLVLFTDLAKHYCFIESGRNYFNAVKLIDGKKFNDPDFLMHENQILLRMCIKCADLSNACKEFRIYDQWVTNIMKEFASQGDLEALRKKDITLYCDRTNPQRALCQKNFLEKLVEPLLQVAFKIAPKLKPILKPNFHKNLSHYTAVLKESECKKIKKNNNKAADVEIRNTSNVNESSNSMKKHPVDDIVSPESVKI